MGEECLKFAGGDRVAQLALQQALQIGNSVSAPTPNSLAELAYYYSLLGEAEIAQNTIKRIADLGQAQNAVSAYYLASAFSVLGDSESFKKARKTAIELGYPDDVLPAWGEAKEVQCEKPPIETACTNVQDLPF